MVLSAKEAKCLPECLIFWEPPCKHLIQWHQQEKPAGVSRLCWRIRRKKLGDRGSSNWPDMMSNVWRGGSSSALGTLDLIPYCDKTNPDANLISVENISSPGSLVFENMPERTLSTILLECWCPSHPLFRYARYFTIKLQWREQADWLTDRGEVHPCESACELVLRPPNLPHPTKIVSVLMMMIVTIPWWWWLWRYHDDDDWNHGLGWWRWGWWLVFQTYIAWILWIKSARWGPKLKSFKTRLF